MVNNLAAYKEALWANSSTNEELEEIKLALQDFNTENNESTAASLSAKKAP